MTIIQLLSIIIPSVIAALGVGLGAYWLRRSNREANQNEAKEGDTNSFKVVTDQLFRLNEDLAKQVGTLNTRVQNVEAELQVERNKNNALSEELEDTGQKLKSSRLVVVHLANYIRQLISNWPGSTPPPAPHPPIDWEVHLEPR